MWGTETRGHGGFNFLLFKSFFTISLQMIYFCFVFLKGKLSRLRNLEHLYTKVFLEELLMIVKK